MSATITSELRKIRTTRSWWILLILAVVVIAAFVGMVGFALLMGGQAPEDLGEPESLAIMIYTMGVSLGYVFPLLLGILVVAGEFRHRTIDTTVLLQPSRVKVIASKFVAVTPFALLYGVGAMVAGLAVGALAFAIADFPLELGNAAVWQALGMGVLAFVAWALVGVGFGAALTNQIAAIVTVLAWTQFVEPTLRIALGFIESLAGIGKFLPGAAGEAIVGTSFYSAAGAGDLLSPWAGLAVLLGYGAVAGLLGWLIRFRKDI